MPRLTAACLVQQRLPVPDWNPAPVATLGLRGPVNDNGQLLDAWHNPIRYSVSVHGLSGERSFTTQPGLKGLFSDLAGSGGLVSDPTLIRVCRTAACGSSDILADALPVMVLSLGARGTSLSSADEIVNASTSAATGNIFVQADYSEENFDDMLVWLSPQLLFSRLITASQLP